MDKKNLSKKQKMLARIQEFTLMDDDFITLWATLCMTFTARRPVT